MKKPLPSRFIYLFPLVSLGVLALVYTGIALYFNRFGVFWSPDSGTRFYMIRDWINHGSLVKPYYSAQNIDPTGKVHLLSFYLLRRQHDFFSMYLPLFPWLSGLMYRLLGYNGLTLIPMLCGLGTVFVTYATARRLGLRSAPLLPLVMGLATPVLIFSVVFWDHTAIFLVTSLAGYGILRSLQTGKLKFAAWAGVALGTGIWLHELVLGLFLAIVAGAIPMSLRDPKQRRVAFALVAGFIPVALCWCLTNTLIYNSPGGPHLGANIVQDNVDHPFNLSVILDPKRLMNSITLQLFGHMTDNLANIGDTETLYVLALMVMVAGYIVEVSRKSSRPWIASFLLIGSAVVALLLLQTTHNGLGLLEVTTLFIPALALLLIHPSVTSSAQRQATPEMLFYHWACLASWAYLILIIVNPMLPGVDWGSRYMLSVAPFLVLLTARALESLYAAAPTYDRPLVLASVAVLVVSSLVGQCYGLYVVSESLSNTRKISQALQMSEAPILVTDTVWLGPDTGAIALPNVQHFLSIRSNADRLKFLSMLHQLKFSQPRVPQSSSASAGATREFTYVGTFEGLRTLSSDALIGQSSFVPEETQYIDSIDALKNDPKRIVMVRFIRQGKAKPLVPTSEAVPVVWRYTIDAPASNWFKPSFDDDSWRTAKGGFGKDAPDAHPRTVWQSDDIYLRRSFTLPADFKERLKHLRVMLRAYHDEDMEVYINGVLACEASGYTTGYETYPLTEEGVATLHPGQNSIAVHCHQNNGGQFIDVGLVEVLSHIESLPYSSKVRN